MKEFVLNENQSGYQLRQVLHKILREAPTSFIYKMLRKKNITLNGRKAGGEEVTAPGDVVRFYLSDETFLKFSGTASDANNASVRKNAGSFKLDFPVVYQDENVLIFVKPQGVLSQKAESGDVSANDFVLDYAKKLNLWDPADPVFRPSIVNRLDRNTEGLMVAGLSAKGLRILNGMFHDRSVAKYYRAIVVGKAPEEWHLSGYLKKDEVRNTVRISEHAQPGADKIETAYTLIRYDKEKDLSLLKVHLITGKSHQIRAHLAHAGFPILGDEKYGMREKNRKFGISMQCLQSCILEVPECDLPGISGRTFRIDTPAFWPVKEQV